MNLAPNRERGNYSSDQAGSNNGLYAEPRASAPDRCRSAYIPVRSALPAHPWRTRMSALRFGGFGGLDRAGVGPPGGGLPKAQI